MKIPALVSAGFIPISPEDDLVVDIDLSSWSSIVEAKPQASSSEWTTDLSFFWKHFEEHLEK